MTQASCFSGPRQADESFLSATLKFVRRCPARPDYVELCFTTSDGWWKWCFSEPPRQEEQAGGRLALTLGRYGPQAHEVREDGEVGIALLSSAALPMILGGAEVYLARTLAATGW